MASVIMPSPASTRWRIRSGRRAPTVVPMAVPARTVPTLISVPIIGAASARSRSAK